MSIWIRILLAIWAGLSLSGCTQSDQDEEKEPHYVQGMSLINAMDYQGAVEAFEESLEMNPHSAAAHYQLAMLDENQQSDPAAAIYHYQEYLKFDPSAENADIIRRHIASCKQQLAADVLPLPSTPASQDQIEKLMDQNRQLQQQINTLQATLKQWDDWYANQMAARSNAAAQPSLLVPQQTVVQTPVQSSQPAATQSPATQPVNSPGPTQTQNTANSARTHVVERGETAMAICRKYGIHLTELESANPSMNPTRIHVGQVLNIP